MSYIMYICPGCRSYFKTGSSGKKIKCLRCKEAFLTDLKITDEAWRGLDHAARQARIDRAIAGEQLREESHVQAAPAEEKKPAVPVVEAGKAKTASLQKDDLPDEVILEAKHILEERDMQADMPRQAVDKRKLAIVCGISVGLLLILSFLSLVVPIFRMKREVPVLSTAQPGDVISFGKYRGNTEWTVLERNDDGIVMMGNYFVASAVPEDIRDKVSQIEWLNSSYINRSFNLYERRKLMPMDEEFGNRIHIMEAGDWERYADLIEIQDDGKVHPMCCVEIAE